MPTSPSEEEKRFVEDIGLIMEEQGRPRIAGRILGWLLICEPPEQSFADLVAVLGVSMYTGREWLEGKRNKHFFT